MKTKLIERIWIKKNKKVKHLVKLVYYLAHFRNLVLIFIHKYHEKTGKWITSSSVLYKMKNESKLAKLKEIESNLDEELKGWLKLVKE